MAFIDRASVLAMIIGTTSRRVIEALKIKDEIKKEELKWIKIKDEVGNCKRWKRERMRREMVLEQADKK